MNIGELAKFRGGVSADTISELTAASGVTLDGVLLKDSNVVPSAGQGIDFSANTGNAGETSSLLDWYEEGDFTPIARAGTTNWTTYTSRVGKYTRIGRLVFFQISVIGMKDSGTTEQFNITGLPWSSATNYPSTAVYVDKIGASNYTVGTLVAGTQVSFYKLAEGTGAAVSLLANDVVASGTSYEVYLTGHYLA